MLKQACDERGGLETRNNLFLPPSALPTVQTATVRTGAYGQAEQPRTQVSYAQPTSTAGSGVQTTNRDFSQYKNKTNGIVVRENQTNNTIPTGTVINVQEPQFEPSLPPATKNVYQPNFDFSNNYSVQSPEQPRTKKVCVVS